MASLRATHKLAADPQPLVSDMSVDKFAVQKQDCVSALSAVDYRSPTSPLASVSRGKKLVLWKPVQGFMTVSVQLVISWSDPSTLLQFDLKARVAGIFWQDRTLV